MIMSTIICYTYSSITLVFIDIYIIFSLIMTSYHLSTHYVTLIIYCYPSVTSLSISCAFIDHVIYASFTIIVCLLFIAVICSSFLVRCLFSNRLI